MPNVSVPASLHGGKRVSVATGVNVTIDSDDTEVTVEVYHKLGVSPFPSPYAVRRDSKLDDISLPVSAVFLSANASVAYFMVGTSVAPGSGKDIGTQWDFICERRHSIAA